MLVITRRDNEGFWLEIEGIEPIHIVLKPDSSKHRCKVAITADPDRVRVYRDEVYVRVLQERATPTSEKGTESCLERLPLNPLPRNFKNV